MESNTTGQGLLSRAECNAMRGLAIIGIFLHNYCHWLAPAVKENEYQFFIHNVGGLNNAIAHADILLPIHLLSFFGHYGVPVFLFLSAYGLYCKYEEGNRSPHDLRTPSGISGNGGFRDTTAVPFIRCHFIKLFEMMIVGFAAFTMFDAITPGPHHYAVADVIAQLGLFNNLLPSPDKIIWPGPYWFFGLMMQLYIVYRLLLYRRHWLVAVALMAVCWLAQVFCEPEGETLNRIRYNFIGGMLPFGCGLLYARFGKKLTTVAHGLVMSVSLALAFLFSLSFQTWFWVPVFAVAFCIGLVKILPRFLNSPLEWMGSVSAALFVCHPITRKIFIPVSRHGDIYTGLLLYIVASVVLAWLFRELMKHIPAPKLK